MVRVHRLMVDLASRPSTNDHMDKILKHMLVMMVARAQDNIRNNKFLFCIITIFISF